MKEDEANLDRVVELKWCLELLGFDSIDLLPKMMGPGPFGPLAHQ